MTNKERQRAFDDYDRAQLNQARSTLRRWQHKLAGARKRADYTEANFCARQVDAAEEVVARLELSLGQYKLNQKDQW